MLKLTKTMLEKSIIDCNAACREYAKTELGIDFEKLACGEKRAVPARYIATGETSEIRFYRTNNARGDRRISIKGIRKNADIGDTVVLIAGRNGETYIEVAK